jgi:cytochrome c biogenesis protein CcmG/thiol:disulfide interchange protein DsbE
MLFVLLVFGATFMLLHDQAQADLKYIGVKVGEPAPDFNLKTLDGKFVRLSSFKGEKIVMIDFWATWCNVCKKELITINEDYVKYRDQGLEVLSIVLNASDEKGVQKIKDSKKLEYPILLDTEWEVSKKYGLEGPIPVKVVIDVKGIIRFTHFGGFPTGENEIPYVVEELLTELPDKTKSQE